MGAHGQIGVLWVIIRFTFSSFPPGFTKMSTIKMKVHFPHLCACQCSLVDKESKLPRTHLLTSIIMLAKCILFIVHFLQHLLRCKPLMKWRLSFVDVAFYYDHHKTCYLLFISVTSLRVFHIGCIFHCSCFFNIFFLGGEWQLDKIGIPFARALSRYTQIYRTFFIAVKL